MGEPKGQSNGARDLGRDWDLPEPILLTLGGSKSSLPILFISQTLGDLWTGPPQLRLVVWICRIPDQDRALLTC